MDRLFLYADNIKKEIKLLYNIFEELLYKKNHGTNTLRT
jgi:hypothetical protein